IQPQAPQADTAGDNVEPLISAYSDPAVEDAAPVTSPEQTPEAPALRATEKLAEAPMDVEKLDLKTALERQRAILKAEREALEAEMAGEAPAEPVAVTQDETRADEAFKEAEVAESPAPVAEFDETFEGDGFDGTDDVDAEVEFDAADADDEDDADAFDAVDIDDDEDVAEAQEVFEASAPVEDAPAALDETAADERWDEGIDDEAEVDAPVDLTRLDEPAVEEETPVVASVEATVRELDIPEEPAQAPEEPVEVGEAAAPAPRRAGRVKTRLLGFQSKTPGQDVFEGKTAEGAGPVRFPVGWLVVTKGEGFGHSFSLLSGVSKIGRGEDQAVKLDFGDTAISRDNHAAIAFDEELNQFFLGHGGKSNVVRLNGKPVLSTEELFDGDEIRIGETTLKFIALCGDEFTWAQTEGNGSEHAASA
ncbi:MAG: FHA domain-containing protein, partial [Pseudomonadota bacterium]